MNADWIRIDINNVRTPQLCIEGNTILQYENESLNILQCNFIAEWDEEQILEGRKIEETKESTIAQMELRVLSAETVDELFYRADSTDADIETAAAVTREYYTNETRDEDEELFGLISCCEIHTLYISPKWRNKGLSKKLFFAIPSVLKSCLNIDHAYIAAYINPFKDQKQEIDDGFTAFYDHDYMNDFANHKIPKKMYEMCEIPLLRAGFMQMESYSHWYITDTDLIWETSKCHNYSHVWENPPI